MEKELQVKNAVNPIGIFDSGVGGTSIWKEIHAIMPEENTIYLADSKNAPYGVKPAEEIIALSEKNTELLLEMKCKIIVIACNTATTNAIKYLRNKYSIPFIGIEPAIKPASLQSKSKAIGILATKGTLSSELFHQTSSLYKTGINIIEQEGTGIVELIETGKLHSQQMKDLLLSYLKPMLEAKIDYLVLGCSHYPYLIPILKTLLPPSISIIDSGLAVANQTKTILEQSDLLNADNSNLKIAFYTNGDKNVLSSMIPKNSLVSFSDF